MKMWQLNAIVGHGLWGYGTTFERNGHSFYAVPHAEEAVKAVAKHLAPSHQEGGVYQVIGKSI